MLDKQRGQLLTTFPIDPVEAREKRAVEVEHT